MLEAGQDLPLVAEALDDGVGVHATAEHLERDAFAKLVVAADGEIDRPHPAAAQFAHEAVRSDLPALDRILRTECRLGDGVVAVTHDTRVYAAPRSPAGRLRRQACCQSTTM
jgi:hypothetical protein